MPTLATGAPLSASQNASDTLGDTTPTPRAPLNAQKLHSLFLGESEFYTALGDKAEPIRKQIATTPDPLRERQRIANTAFLADRFELPASEVAARYDSLRQSYARQMFPDMPAVSDEGVFHSAVRDQLQTEAQERELQGEMSRRLFEAALDGQDFKTAWTGMNITAAIQSNPKRADVYNGWALQQWESQRSRAALVAPALHAAETFFAARRSGAIDNPMTGLTNANSAEQAYVVDELMRLPADERGMVLAMAAERAGATGQRERGAVRSTVETLAEGVGDLTMSALVGLHNTTEAVIGYTPQEQSARERSRVELQVQRAMAGEVDPIKGDSFAGQVALDFTRSMPMMLAAMTPAGLAVDFMALKQNARENLEAQGTDGATAEGVATLQAIPQTALFFATSKMVFAGKVPKAFGTSIPSTLAVEYVGNFALNEAGFLTDAGIQATAASLTENVPEVDWQQFGQSFKDRLPQQLAFAIPGALIGTGVATFKNRASGERYLKQPELLDDLGFTPEAKEAVIAAPDYPTTEQAFKDGFAERDIESQATIALEMDAQREALRAAEPGVIFEALTEAEPQADPKLLSEAEALRREIIEDEDALGKLAPKRRVRRKSIEGRLEQMYLRELEIQAELDVPGAREAYVQYQEQLGAPPPRGQLVYEYLTKRKIPAVENLREIGSMATEIADLDLPRKMFDRDKRVSLDRVAESITEYLAENGDQEAAARLARGEGFTEAEAVDLISEAMQAGPLVREKVPVPRIPWPDKVEAAAQAAEPVTIAPRVDATVEPLGRRYLVAEGVGEPVEQFQVKRPGEERGVTMTREQLTTEGITAPPSTLTEIATVRSFDGPAFQQWSRQQKGGFTTTAHNLGREVKSRREVNALLAAETEASAQLAEAMDKAKGGDFDAMNEAMLLSTKAQFFREAYEAALGVLSAGDHLRKKDPNYVPPIVRNADGTYTVAAVDGAPPVTASSPEGAAMVADAQRTEATQQAATQPPEPRPENDDGRPLPPRITALNKEAITALRALFNMDELDTPTRERFIQVLDEAKRTEAHRTADEIAADLIATGRVSSASEHAALILRSAELQNAYEAKTAEIGEAFAAGDMERAAGLRTVADNLLAQLDTLTEASDKSGTAIARALSIRRMRLNRDNYALVPLIQRARAAKRADLTPEQQTQLASITEELTKQQAIIEDQKRQLALADFELAKARAETFVAEGRNRRRSAVAQDAATRRKALKGELLKMGLRVNDVTSLIPGSFEWGRIVAKIADTYIEEGVASLTELTNKLKADIPDLSDQDIYMAVGRQTQKQAKRIENEAKRRVKELRSQAALWAKINAALEDKRPDGSPINRTQRNQILRQTLAELRKQANRTTFDDAALARVDAKIAEVQAHLAKGTRPAAVPRPEGNQKLNAAKETLKQLRQEMGAIDTIAELERMVGEAEPKPVAEGKPAPKPSPTEQQAKLNTLRERIAELRDQIDQAQVDPAAVNADRLARLQRLSAELETQLEEGFRPLREPSRAMPDTDEVAAARRQVREIERLMRTEDSIADLEEQIRTGEFKVSAPEKRTLSNAKLEQAMIRQKQLRRQADELIEQMRAKTVGERVVEVLLVPRTLLATADMSAMLRQGLLLSASRPATAARTFVASLRAMFNENTADAIALSIERRPGWQLGEKAGLFLSEHGGSLRAAEEHFMSNFAERIPGVGRVVKASNRAMVTTLNMLRVAAFDGFVKAHPEATPEQLKAYARYVNAASGRGNVKWSPSTVKTANALFFAPRYAVSRFQALYSPFKNINDPIVRNAILKDFGALLGTGMSVLALAALAGAEVTMDPTDSDFGKIVVDDTRIDIWGGLQQPARLVLSVPAALLTRTEIAEFEKEVDPLESGLRFMSYKVSPAISVPRALLTGENAIGQDQELSETLIRSITPLMLQEAYDVHQNTESEARTAGALAAGFFGVGISEHNN